MGARIEFPVDLRFSFPILASWLRRRKRNHPARKRKPPAIGFLTPVRGELADSFASVLAPHVEMPRSQSSIAWQGFVWCLSGARAHPQNIWKLGNIRITPPTVAALSLVS
jgi:hypothetical protein